MNFDLLIPDLREPLYEAAIAAARLGHRVAVVDGGDFRAAESVTIADVRQSLLELRRVDPAASKSNHRWPGVMVERLWLDAVNRAECARQFREQELRRHGVTFLTPNDDPVHTDISLRLRRSPQIVIPAEAETISLTTLLQLPALPERILIGVGGLRGVEYATLLASLGVYVELPANSLPNADVLDEEVTDCLLDRYRPGRIELTHDDESRPNLVLVECPTDSSYAIAHESSRCLEIDDAPQAGARLIERELSVRSDSRLVPTHSLQTLPAVASAGVTASLLKNNLETGSTAILDADTSNDGFLKLVFHRQTRRLLGVHCVGENARELVDIGAAVIQCGGTIDDLRNSLFAVAGAATPFRDAALDGLRKLQRRTLPSLNVALYRPGESNETAMPRRKSRDVAPRVRRVKRPTAARRSTGETPRPRLHRATN